MKRLNSRNFFKTFPAWKVQTIILLFLITISGLTATFADAEALILVDATNPAAAETLEATDPSVYYYSDRFILAGVEANRLAALKSPCVRVLDLNPWTEGTLYYWVVARGSERIDVHFAEGILILFQAEGVVLVKARPVAAERLPLYGYEIIRVNRTPKPYGRAIQPGMDTFESGRFSSQIDAMVAAVTQTNYTNTIQTLEDFVTRYTYTSNIDDAADWIYGTFQSFGLDVERHYFQISGHTKQNIIATKTGTVYPDEVVFITGHYDSISNDPYNLAPGADDNASGTAAVIEAARIMAHYNFERTIKFACFAGEEQGLVGSSHYVSDIYNAGMNVLACFNLDMIGWSGSDPAPPDLIIYTNSASTAVADKLRDAALYYLPSDLEPIIINQALSASDHASFWQYGYQAILGIEDEAWGSDFNPYYHTTNDTVANCDLEYATNCTRAGVAAFADYAVPMELSSTYLTTGPGPGYANPPLVRVFPPQQDGQPMYEFDAYGSPHWGVHVTSGDVNDDGRDEILTGAGPGQIFGPHVRGFQNDGTPLAGLSFMAYGTSRYGVLVAAGDVDGDSVDEIITGPGPGQVFGPHVRAFGYTGANTITPLPGVNFMAYGTRQWGANVAGGDIDRDGFDEIITGAGPGIIFGPHVRGWNVDGGSAAPIPAVSYFAYGTKRYGVIVSSGDLDGDGREEILTAPGPSGFFGAHIRGWKHDGSSTSPLSGCSFLAWPSSQARYGAQVFAGADLDEDGRDELVVGAGPDPAVTSPVKVFRYTGTDVTAWFSLQAYPGGWFLGTGVAAGRL